MTSFTIHHSNSGSVLLMVLIMSAILFLAAATLLFLTTTELRLADYEERSTQAFYAAESSITLGLSELRKNHIYRAETTKDMTIGGNLSSLNVQFYVGYDQDDNLKTPNNDGSYYRAALAPSLYHFILRGTGSVSGLYAPAKRTVERDIVIKPFAVFAENTLIVNGDGECTIEGNVHANGLVTLGVGSKVNGNVTSNTSIQDDNEGTITPGEEVFLALPELRIGEYFPTYWFHDQQYEAQPLVYEEIELSPAGKKKPPSDSIELYRGSPDPVKNPAGVFYPDLTVVIPTTAALDIEGTLIIPEYPGDTFTVHGLIKIIPVENFPAVVSVKNLDFQFTENLRLHNPSKLKPSKIEGLIYSENNITCRGEGTTGTLIKGSLFGQGIVLTTDLMLGIDDNNAAILSTPPPGLDLIDLGEWREIIDPDE